MVYIVLAAILIGFIYFRYPEQVKKLIGRFRKPAEPVVVPPATPLAPPPQNVAVAPPSAPQGMFSPFPTPSTVAPDPTPVEPQGRFGPFPTTPVEQTPPPAIPQEPKPAIDPLPPQSGTQSLVPFPGSTPIPQPGGTAAGSMYSVQAGVTYCFKVQQPRGLLQVDPVTGGGVGAGCIVEAGISDTAGDWASAKAYTESSGSFGVPTHTRYEVNTGSGGMTWKTPDVFMNLRFSMSGRVCIQLAEVGA